jgi:ribonuclease Z
MKMTLTRTAETYTVHELLTSSDPLTPCLPASPTNDNVRDPDVLHVNEIAGSDILCAHDYFWRSITTARGGLSEITVDAGPIQHRG